MSKAKFQFWFYREKTLKSKNSLFRTKRLRKVVESYDTENALISR